MIPDVLNLASPNAKGCLFGSAVQAIGETPEIITVQHCSPTVSDGSHLVLPEKETVTSIDAPRWNAVGETHSIAPGISVYGVLAQGVC